MKTLVPTIGLFLILASNAWAGGHWRFERTYVDGEETKTPDWSGNGNHGTLVNAPTLVAGRVGRGMEFDGVDDYVDFGELNNLYEGSDKTTHSISFWIKPTNTGSSNHVMAEGTSVTQKIWHLRVLSDGAISYRDWEDAGTIKEKISDTGVINFDEWGHIVITRDDDTKELKVYYNDNKVIDGTAYDYVGGDPPFWIGRWRDSYFNGTIDEPIITPFAWTAEEVRAYYHSGEVPSRREE